MGPLVLIFSSPRKFALWRVQLRTARVCLVAGEGVWVVGTRRHRYLDCPLRPIPSVNQGPATRKISEPPWWSNLQADATSARLLQRQLALFYESSRN